ncbi:MAG: YdhR family protein [candidate division Zixibacteria bacterium]|nr:YdhR family protein [candidate division Zixibacteria bacterium]
MKRRTEREHSHVGPVVLVVRFHFARFSQTANRRLSLIPILLIAGFPGFHEKIWMINEENGEWLGLYEWETERVAKDYEKSFVLRLMTRRAEEGSVSLRIIRGASVSGYLQKKDRSIAQ